MNQVIRSIFISVISLPSLSLFYQLNPETATAQNFLPGDNRSQMIAQTDDQKPNQGKQMRGRQGKQGQKRKRRGRKMGTGGFRDGNAVNSSQETRGMQSSDGGQKGQNGMMSGRQRPGQRRFMMMDTNGDKKISKAEFLAIFSNMDVDSDGFITPEEMRKYQMKNRPNGEKMRQIRNQNK